MRANAPGVRTLAAHALNHRIAGVRRCRSYRRGLWLAALALLLGACSMQDETLKRVADASRGRERLKDFHDLSRNLGDVRVQRALLALLSDDDSLIRYSAIKTLAPHAPADQAMCREMCLKLVELLQDDSGGEYSVHYADGIVACGRVPSVRSAAYSTLVDWTAHDFGFDQPRWREHLARRFSPTPPRQR